MKSDLHHILGLYEVGAHERPAAQHWARRLHWVMLFVVLLTIPAFYLELAAPDTRLRLAGPLLYLFVAAAFACYFLGMSRLVHERWNYLKRNWLDLLILIGAALSLAGWAMAISSRPLPRRGYSLSSSCCSATPSSRS